MRYEQLSVGHLTVDKISGSGGPIDLGKGQKWYLQSSTNGGSDGNSGKTAGTALATFASAYAAMTADQNDTLIVLPGNYSFTSTLTWAKSFTHIACASLPITLGHQTYISHGADMTTMLTISASDCIFKGFRIAHGRGTAGNTTNTSITGSRNIFKNMHFDGPGNTAEGAVAYREVNLGSGAKRSAFYDCTFGNWWCHNAGTDTSSAEVYFTGNNHGTRFKDCLFMCYITETDHCILDAWANMGGESALSIVEDSVFYNGDADKTLAHACLGPEATGTLLLKNCAAYNITDWSIPGNTHCIVTMPSANEAGGIGTHPT